MKKSIIFVGSAAALAVVFYLRPESAPTQEIGSLVAPPPPITTPGETVLQQTVGYTGAPKIPQIVQQEKRQQAEVQIAESTEIHEEFPLPEALVDETLVPATEVDLWELPPDGPTTLIDDLPTAVFSMDAKTLSNLRVGQLVRLQLPDGAGEVEAEINETYNDPAGVQVWTGSIKDDVNQASIIFTRGETQTHILIASTQGNYSAVVDNHSGDGTLINESTIHSRQLPYDDGIVYRPGDTEATHQH